MNQILYLEDPEKMTLNTAKEIDFLQLNGVEIWMSNLADEYILNVTSVNSANHSGEEDAIGIWFTVTTGQGGGTVTIGDSTYTVAANTTETIKHTTTEDFVTDVVFKGDFTNIKPETMSKSSSSAQIAMADINYIVKWFKNKDYMMAYQFQYQGLFNSTLNIDLPSYITTLDISAFLGCSFAASQDINSTFTFSDNIQNVIGFGGISTAFFKNASIDGNVWKINDIALQAYGSSTSFTQATIPNGTRLMASNLFGSLYNNGVQHAFPNLATINLPTDNILEEIPDRFCEMCSKLTTINAIPASVRKIGVNAFAYTDGSMALAELRFNQPAGMYVELPTAGAEGMFKVKTARSMTIYTDNEYIKNYDYASDNITPTFYHLDGSAWS